MRKIVAVKLSVCKQWNKMKTQGTFKNNNKFMKYLLKLICQDQDHLSYYFYIMNILNYFFKLYKNRFFRVAWYIVSY